MMTDHEIEDAARHMLSETLVRRMQFRSNEWLNLLTRRCPQATITDREHIAMRAAEMIAQWREKIARVDVDGSLT
jgi:hypothetical protein